MCKMLKYNELVHEISLLNIRLSEYNSKIELARINLNEAPKWFKWFYKMDLDDYIQIQSKLMYRYKVLKSIKENFYKFVAGITRSEYKDTRKLVELLDKLKMIEALDILQVQVEDNNIALKNLQVRVDLIKSFEDKK